MGAQKIYRVLHESPGEWFTRERLAEQVAMEAAGGSFQTYISRLCSLGLAERVNGGVQLNRELGEI